MSVDSESESGSEVEPFKLYRDRNEWSDITPVKQSDGDVPVVPMEYAENFLDIFDYFRGLMAVGEKSERGLELCADAIFLNPANYTVWHYRREIIKHLKIDLYEELEYVSKVIQRSPKNYQVWHHRKEIVEWMNYGDEELKFTADILSLDAKNYHAWQHRQWVISKFQLFTGELDYVDELLKQDVRNNSAWTHRYFIIDSTVKFNPQIVDAEVQFCIAAIEKAYYNESVWNYLKGVLEHDMLKLNKPEVFDYVYRKYEEGIRSVHLQIYLIDATVQYLATDPNNTDKLNFVLQLLNDLITTHDQIRAKYWTSIRNGLEKKYGMQMEHESSE